MRLRRCGVDILAVLVASLAIQCVITDVNATDEEQAAREWLEKFYPMAEQCMFALMSANWDFNVNITAENEQRLVSCNK